MSAYGRILLKSLAGSFPALWIVACLLGSNAFGSGLPKVEIRVAQTSLVPGHEIFLGDIAQIQAGPFLREVLVKVGLGNAPRPGQIKQITQNRLVSLIRSHQGLPQEMEIFAPEVAYVKRASQQITPQEIRNQVDLFLAERFKGKEVELAHVEIKEMDPLPLGEIRLAPASRSYVDRQGNFTVFMDILVDGNREESVRIPGKVAVYEQILCALKNLKKGDPLLEKELSFVRQNIFTLPEDLVRKYPAGKIVKTDIQKASPIRSSWLKEIPLIHKGDIITLVAKTNNLTIVTTGISREDGYAHDLIRVENIGSGKVVQGQVLEKSTVEVIY